MQYSRQLPPFVGRNAQSISFLVCLVPVAGGKYASSTNLSGFKMRYRPWLPIVSTTMRFLSLCHSSRQISLSTDIWRTILSKSLITTLWSLATTNSVPSGEISAKPYEPAPHLKDGGTVIFIRVICLVFKSIRMGSSLVSPSCFGKTTATRLSFEINMHG